MPNSAIRHDRTSRLHGVAAVCMLALIASMTAACGSDAPEPARLIDPPQEEVSRVGDISIRAHVLQTSNLSEQMARQYGLNRGAGTVMLLVGLRQGPEGREVSLPARITASATDLQGRNHTIEMRELRAGDLLDYVGTVEIAPPETLRFELKIVREDGAVSDMRFSRDFRKQ